MPTSCMISRSREPSRPITLTRSSLLSKGPMRLCRPCNIGASGLCAACIMIHLLFLFHRYLGIAVGALMAMWCVSGVVMMYVSYPELHENSRRHHLTPIVWSSCCKISDEVLADDDPVSEFQVEMLAGRTVLQLGSGRKYRLIDLVAGSVIDRVSTHQAVEVAKAFAEEALPVAPRLLGLIDHDQWTVSGSFNADRPLYHFSMGDKLGTELYVS